MARKHGEGHHFTVKTPPHVIKVTDDWSHHREVFVSTGDLDAYQKMLDSVTAVPQDNDAS